LEAEDRKSTKLFRELSRSMLREGFAVRFRARGRSMFPAIHDDDLVTVAPVVAKAKKAEVVLTDSVDGVKVHRVERSSGETIRTRGDSCIEDDGALSRDAVLGRVVQVEDADGGRRPPRFRHNVRRLLRLLVRR
jgi:phage repressor protein C with HTH and peptisase S24 domain